MKEYHHLPLYYTRNIQAVFNKLRKYLDTNSTIIQLTKDEDFELHFEGIGANSHFFFKVVEVLRDDDAKKITYVIAFKPESQFSLEEKQLQIPDSRIHNFMNLWLDLLKQYNALEIHPKDRFSQIYEEEFNDWFEIVDDDADQKPFQLKQQLFLSESISKSILALKEAGLEDDQLFEDAKEIQDNLSQMSKKQIFALGRKLYAKIRLGEKGLERLKIVYSVCRQEAIAMGFRLTTSTFGEEILKLFI